ncbi:SusC/RagA family TonB-linked outer membrane protein [Paraflavitalea sp. CAU 1676]|uniref:SusC/RagA family TonB-linked outer membrane protein n=1 Tax=Paraflavitalea sp. CAU 1676 TaxID=3032598 RepID=UPI0023DB7166|nr:SusC/RagA family TonB-linked outer membrane protein [Paraflavitalea sp. CAU 1676]MDF2187136.1 SusC/RagA family TonB-linked outer membrane protein [Paraflavitalea sp. CAU 1676]
MRKILCTLLCTLLILVQLVVQAQERTISGKVTDAAGAPVVGASVTVKGSSLGTSSGSDGAFTLRLPASAKTIIVSAVGYAEQELAIGSKSVFAVSLTVEGKGLDEVIVTGYGVQKRSQYAGAASKVDAKAINQVPNGSIDQILQGRAPGLYVAAGSGQPGAAANVIIRGVGTIGGVSTPLYIMDGVPIQSATFSALSPSDIASVDVLKDAVATALYGSRGSNGVIVITTKRGKANGRITYGAKAQIGFSDRTRPKFEMMDSKQRMQYEEEVGIENDVTIGPGWYLSRLNPANNGLPESTLKRYDQIRDSLGNSNADWEDIFFRRGHTQEYEVSASGGGDKTAFYSSLNYFKQDGIAIRSALERFSFRTNFDVKTDRLTLGISSTLNYANSSFIESENNTSVANPFASVYYALPYELPYKDGVLLHPGNSSGPDGSDPLLPSDPDKPYLVYDQREGSTALERMLSTTRRNNEIKAVLGANIKFKIYDGLSIISTLGLDFRELMSQRFIDPNTYTGTLVTGAQGSFSEGSSRFMRLFGNVGFNYNNSFGDKHAVDASVLVENTRANARNFSYVGFGINPLLPNTPAAITPGSENGFIPTVGGGRDLNVLQSLIGIVRYTYDGKYTLNGSYRMDRSSMVPEKNRSISYFAAGATWNVLKEEFMANVEVLSELQLRASYGTSASPFTSSFGYLALYGATSYNGVPGNGVSQLANDDYDWEYANTTNIGIDFSLFSNRLRGTIELYNKATKNLFVSQKLSAWSGSTSLDINAGKMRNRGIELALSGDIVANNFLRWTVGGNIAYNKNEITSLGQVNEFENGTAIIRVGLPYGSHFIPKWGGVDAATGYPLYYNKDGSLTTEYNSATQSVAEFGTFLPKVNGGFNTTVNYKNFYLEAFFSYSAGNKRFNNEDFFNETSSFATSNQSTTLLNRWRKPGDVTNIQKFGTSRSFSSKDIQDASFVRFRNLNVGYNVPRKWLQEMRIFTAATAYVQCQNLYTWSNWRGFDPEDNNNISTFEYPPQRTFTFGINLTF